MSGEIDVRGHTRVYRDKEVPIRPFTRKRANVLGFKSPEKYTKAKTSKGTVMLTERELKIALKRAKKLMKK